MKEDSIKDWEQWQLNKSIMVTEWSITEIQKKKIWKDTGLMRKFYFKDDNETMKLLYEKQNKTNKQKPQSDPIKIWKKDKKCNFHNAVPLQCLNLMNLNPG